MARDPQLHVALAGVTAWIWVDAGRRPEGMRRTRAAMAEIGPGTMPRLEARLLLSWAWLAHPIVGPPELAAMTRAVELYRQLNDRRALYAALCNQARFLPYCGLLEEAERALQEAESLFDPAWPPRLRSVLLGARGYLYDVQGRLEESLAVGEEILQLATALGDKRSKVAALINLEQTFALLGRLEESVRRGRELQQLMQQDRSMLSGNEHFVLVNLNMSLTLLGRVDEALEVARSALPVIEKAGRMADMIEQCGLLAFGRGHTADAARLLGRADKSFAAGHFRRDPMEAKVRGELVLGLQRALAAPELARLRREGEALSDEQAVRLGLRD